MDDDIRVSDADRERVTALLRDNYAEGRLSADELDERLAAALDAKTFGDLRRLVADLPQPTRPAAQAPPPYAPPRLFRRRPRLLPILLIVLLAALVLPRGGGLLFVFFKAGLVVLLLAGLAGLFVAGQVRRHVRRAMRSGPARYWTGPGRYWAGPAHYCRREWRGHRRR